MITANASYTLQEGSKVFFDGLNIYCTPTVHDASELVRIQVDVQVDAGTVVGSIVLEATYAEVDAFTGSGTTDVEVFFNQCEQLVDDHLSNLTDNAGVTFSIV